MKNIIYFLVATTLLFAACNTPDKKNAEKAKLDSIAKADSIKKEKINSLDTLIVIDIDGNVYHTVTIGTQVWMAENLKTTHYRNGNTIPNISDSLKWNDLKTGAYCNYNNDTTFSNVFGKLYNWYAVNDNHKLCPSGWHLPSDAEWTTLEIVLGMSQTDADKTGWRGTNEGGKLKETGTTHWNSANAGATNSSGFSALPGGFRNDYGTFYSVGDYGYWWSASEYAAGNAWSTHLHGYDSNVRRDYLNKEYGFSVRCVKDN